MLRWCERVEWVLIGFACVQQCSDVVVVEVREPEPDAFQQVVRCFSGSVVDLGGVLVGDLSLPEC